MAAGGGPVASPDANAIGLTSAPVDPLRYDGQSDNPAEVAGLMHSLMPEKARVLDVGCGTGSVNVIANRGKQNDVVAIEPDGDRAALASARGIDVHVGLLTQEFIDSHGLFDVVMSSDVLEHVAAPADLLSLMVRALKPGGHVLLSVPNVAHWSIRLSLALGKFNYAADGMMDATHLRWFTDQTFRALVESCGCEIVAVRQSAGAGLGIYYRRPMSWVPASTRQSVVRGLTRLRPTLFGAQHVILAQTPAKLH